jgi:hypothetical protein
MRSLVLAPLMRALQDASTLVAANLPHFTLNIIFLPIEGGSDPYLQWLCSAAAKDPH